MKVDLERLRRVAKHVGFDGTPAVFGHELAALLAVVDAARNGVRAWSRGAYADIDCGSLEAALEPFGPPTEAPNNARMRTITFPANDARAWEEVDRWHARWNARDLGDPAIRLRPDAKPNTFGNPRDRARDQLADAGVAVQRQFRSDQERIAELEAERDEWKGRHKAVTNGLSNHVARADQAEERIAELERELADVQEQLWDSWWSYHDEHCHDPWPHDGSCSYPPPAAARERRS